MKKGVKIPEGESVVSDDKSRTRGERDWIAVLLV
jgi:hypothetical protein